MKHILAHSFTMLCITFLTILCIASQAKTPVNVIDYNKIQDEIIDSEMSGNGVTTDSNGNKVFTVKGVTFKMIKVKGGTFMMGATEQNDNADEDEKPAHQVTLNDYYIGEYEVTQELWRSVMGYNPSHFKGNNLPVEQVSWNECREFVKRLNKITGKQFRLPTEAEWEYAARGGCKSQGYVYSGSNNIADVAWYSQNSGKITHKVGSAKPNELGIYDMTGNVWEWCNDWYGKYRSGSQTNPQGPSSGSYRILRGGGWDGSASFCGVSKRAGTASTDKGYEDGLRLVLAPYPVAIQK